jgi:hypothetical protein
MPGTGELGHEMVRIEDVRCLTVTNVGAHDLGCGDG